MKALIATLILLFGLENCLADDRPNIIVIMADDMGYADAGFTGATDIQTPHLDALAASGVTFTNGYVTHVPFIASWPAKIRAGTKFDDPVISLDIAATAVALATNKPTPAGNMEGVNLIPLLTEQAGDVPHDFLYWREGGERWSILNAARTKHVLDDASGTPEIFHLPADISEQNDRADDEPELAKQLHRQWSTWNESNVASRIDGYKTYHKQRDQFFLDSIPGEATKQGYAPTPIPTFK